MTYYAIMRHWDVDNVSELHISTTLVVNNLLQKESQSVIVRTIKKLFGEDNIVGMSFGHTPKHKDDIQTRWCHLHPKRNLILWLLSMIEFVYCKTWSKTFHVPRELFNMVGPMGSYSHWFEHQS